MHILLQILTGVGFLVSFILIVAVFVKKELNAQREITINKSKQYVFDYVKFLKNQEFYGKWNLMDLNMTKSCKGTDGTVGFVYGWESNNKSVGKGEQEIKSIIDGERLDFELRFEKPMKSIAQAYIITEAVDASSTRVIWGFKSKMVYPFNFIRLFMNMEALIGKDFQTGLDNLKSILEKS
jgi:hypothetical protein